MSILVKENNVVELDPFKREDEEEIPVAEFSPVAWIWIIFGNIIFWSLVIYLIRGCIR
jgi:hypothetical protein